MRKVRVPKKERSVSKGQKSRKQSQFRSSAI